MPRTPREQTDCAGRAGRAANDRSACGDPVRREHRQANLRGNVTYIFLGFPLPTTGARRRRAQMHEVTRIMPHPQRKKKFIDPQVQGALVRRLVFHWLAFIGVAAAVSFALQVLTNPFQPLREHAASLWRTQGPFLIVLVFMLPVFIVDTIKISHRFAGPIYRLRQTIRGLAQGSDFEPLRFRDYDFWQGLAQDFNNMVERFRGNDDSEDPKLNADQADHSQADKADRAASANAQ